jgi:S1-C subfamily serine protease
MKAFICLAAALLAASVSGEQPRSETDPRRDATVEAVERVLPSVVNISTATIIRVEDPFERMLREFYDPYHRPAARAQYSLGSGVVVDEDGYLLTNDHVVRRADQIEVTIGTNSYSAHTVARDSATDLALLKIDDKSPGRRFHAAKFARDDDLYLGETVVALGNPFGLGGSVSRGILSSKNRRPTADKGPLDIEDWLQTDAAINPGNSGGPLIDLRGELIGLNVAIYRGGEQAAQGIGFAIPIKRISETLSEMFTPERVNGVMFGARIRSNAGAPIISRVHPSSPAARAGIKTGDLISMVDQKTPRNFIEATEMILLHGEGDLLIGLRRGGERRDVVVPLVTINEIVRRKLGFQAKALSQEQASQLRLAETPGLVVSEVERSSPAARARLEPGHVILAIDGQAVTTLADAAYTIAEKKKGDAVVLDVAVQERRGLFVELARVPVELKVR